MKMKKTSLFICMLLLLFGNACKKEMGSDPQRIKSIGATTTVENAVALFAVGNHTGGILHTEADFERMRVKVNANVQPWKGSWDLLLASPYSASTWVSHATSIVIRGGTGDNVAVLYRDVVDLGTGYFKIFNRANGICPDSGGGAADGSNMVFWSNSTSNNQQWGFVAP